MASPTTRLTAELLPQAAATQDVTLPTIASGATLASPTVAPGAIGITMPAISSGATLFAPTVAPGAVAVILPTISSGATLAAPTVAPGAVAVVLPFITSGATLYAPTVIPPAQAIILHGAPIEWVANPDFEVDDADWSADAGVTIMRTTSESHGGTASLEIVIEEGDNMIWQDYAPDWESDGDPPDIGDGSLSGRYAQAGDTIFVWIAVVFGSTTDPGTGAWKFSLPVADARLMMFGAGVAIEDGVGDHTVTPGTYNSFSLRVLTGEPVQLASVTVPFTWGASDSLFLTFWYERYDD